MAEASILMIAPSHQPQFDTLRALAVLAVTSDHFAVDIPNFPVPDCVRLGPLGVRFFLVLSGYFITVSLLRMRVEIEDRRTTKIEALWAFYGKRFLRIGPPYLLFTAIGLLLGLGTMREQFPWLITFTVNFLIAIKQEWPEVSSHLWSICVQEQFYLFWPSLIFLVPRRLMLPAMIGLGILCFFFKAGCILDLLRKGRRISFFRKNAMGYPDGDPRPIFQPFFFDLRDVLIEDRAKVFTDFFSQFHQQTATRLPLVQDMMQRREQKRKARAAATLYVPASTAGPGISENAATPPMAV